MLYLGIVLHFLGIIFAAHDSLSADLQTLVNLSHRVVSVVEAVHAATRAFIVHYVELFVKESIETKLPCLETCRDILKHLLIHVFVTLLAFSNLEEISQFIMGLCLRIKIHLCLFLNP